MAHFFHAFQDTLHGCCDTERRSQEYITACLILCSWSGTSTSITHSVIQAQTHELCGCNTPSACSSESHATTFAPAPTYPANMQMYIRVASNPQLRPLQHFLVPLLRHGPVIKTTGREKQGSSQTSYCTTAHMRQDHTLPISLHRNRVMDEKWMCSLLFHQAPAP